jgi:hypothetical protein
MRFEFHPEALAEFEAAADFYAEPSETPRRVSLRPDPNFNLGRPRTTAKHIPTQGTQIKPAPRRPPRATTQQSRVVAVRVLIA